ncbi:hypothetical protein NDA11_000049 [Ustilago hordei]|uniref:Uncharacterized protein n=1 Tax=Ustilago hordei TaxID=120017 RepID=I2FSY2_USTHO|nr:hypothetical protein NDA11_000049 [Ustilago hordei]KAJ1587097.1 hypothetical protein NDA15_001975 [Ustilago hordei]KAJ1589914.1 hypothetical protein NDA12_002162 [Ustilago hordei]CCF50025.1 uncharacterized protein UHOR_14168 [Ustilago hordei]
MSFIDKVFEAGSWDVSLPTSPTPPSNTEQEQGAPPVLSLAMGSSTILPCPSPVTSPINQMSDTPSTQSTRPADNGAKKNFIWQAQDIEHLVDMIYINESYQHAILPSHCNKANEPANKLCKDMVYCDLSKSVFPARSVDPSHIKFKVHWLQETYHWEKKALSLTGAGTMLKDMDAMNPSYRSQVALSAKYPWFEKMHKMMNECVLAGPAILLTTPSLDVTGNEDSNHVLPSSDPMEESSDADLGHTVHTCNLPPIHDLVDAAPRNAGDYPNFDISTPPPHPILLDALVSSLSTFSNWASPSQANGYKCKHINVEQKWDLLAEAFYQSLIESLSICLKLAQEHTKQEAEHTKQEELQLQHECKEREQEEHLHAQERECKECVHLEDHNVFIEMMHMMVTQQ